MSVLNIYNALNSTSYEHIFVLSDLHLYRDSIQEDCNDNLKEKDFNKFIESFNSQIKENDIVIYCGDLSHKEVPIEYNEKISNFVKSLNGDKILIKGNHDTKDDDFYYSCGFISVMNEDLKLDHFIFSHFPKDTLTNYPNFYNIHGHIHGHLCDSEDFKEFNYKNHIDIYFGNFKDYFIPSLKYIEDHLHDLDENNFTNTSGSYIKTVNGKYVKEDNESLAGIAPVTNQKPEILVKPYSDHRHFINPFIDIDEYEEYIKEDSLTKKERDNLNDNEFGLPKERLYPLNDKEHIRKAIQFFHYCKGERREELAKNIKKAADKNNIKITEKSLIWKYI